ncbi:hypothetical protein HXX76_011634 [Chlamydomonas incerta]|uniref:Uncharacterized protein n=1 Tax=Chlamydomonas incerta TaxID=51695 RepID=A0A835VTB6_CHLIN|nr:hypothetical protein HXX76_011634 [Chlamydomonas incerta]|eukprot:KAG2428517.1 hypothetical protein HXX76_011634 [Chlamydomonas incerta]
MAATSPLVRLRRFALPLALVALCAAAAHGQTLTSAVLTAANTISATLTNSTSSADCRAAFVYLDSNNATKAASPFANCTATGTSVTLILASGVSYAAGDQLNVKVNQTTLNTTAGAPFVAAATPLAVRPVLVSGTLTGASTLVVKLPLSGNSVPTDFATNMTICGGALQLLSAAGTAKSSLFTACALSGDVITLTLAGAYAAGDAVNVVSGQTILLFGTTAYTRNATATTIMPTLVSVTLASTSSIAVGASAPVALAANASAAVCNSIFDVKLSNGTLLPAAFASCSVGPVPTTVTAVFANGTSYAGGMTINLRANQTSLVAAPAGPLVVPLATALAISPTILSASLTTATTIVVALPVASATSGTFDCNSVFELRSAGAATATATPFTDCALSANGLAVTLTVTVGKYKAGDTLNVKSTNTILNVAGTNYVPKAVPVLPTITAAYLISSTVVSVSLPVPSALPAVYAAADCARSIIIAAANSTVAKPISACALAAGASSLLVTLGAGATFVSGDTVNVQADQWTLRAGQTVTVGPTYVPSPAPVAIMPAFTSAVLTGATTIVVQLPAASALATGDCNSAFQLVSGGASPFASCALGATNTTLTLNLTASTEYTVGFRVSPKNINTLLTVGNSSYAYLPVAINPTLLPSTTAVLVSPTSILVTLPFASYLPSTANATHCNAAFELKSAAGTAKTAPFTACAISGGTALTLTIAAGTYTAGDTLGVKGNNTVFLGASSSGPAYVPATAAITITPTIVAAAISGTSTVFVTLSAPATLNTSACNSAFVVTGKSSVFANCTLSPDSLSVTLMLTAPSSVAGGDTINVVASQTALMAGTVAFLPATTARTVADAVLVSAHLASLTTLVAKLSVPSVAAASFASSCNNVFVVANSSGAAKSTAISSCVLTDSTTATLTISSSTFVAGDTLNIKSGQTFLTALDAAGPAIPAAATAKAIAPAITTAVATAYNTFLIPLPLQSDLGAGCTSSFTVASAAGTAKTVTGCALINNKTSLTVTISATGTGADAPFAAGDTITIVSGQAVLKATAAAGAYGPLSPVTIVPSVGIATVTAEKSVTVVLPGVTSTYPSPLTPAACNAAIGVYSAGSLRSIASCAISGSTASTTTMSLTLASSYVGGDTITVVQTAYTAAMSVGTAAYGPLPTAAFMQPTLVSAKAVSLRSIWVTLPAASTFVKTDAAVAALDQSDCGSAITISPSRTLNATSSCNLNSTSGTILTITLDTATYVAGDTIDIANSQAFLVAGSKSGPAYISRSALNIAPALVTSAVASAPDTIMVKLPFTAILNTGVSGASNLASLTAAQCAASVEIKSGTSTRVLSATNPCTVSGTVLTIKLNGTGSDVYSSGDTFNFKDTNTLIRDSTSKLAYQSMPVAAIISPMIVSAMAIAQDTFVITLPVSSTFGGSTTPTNAQCSAAASGVLLYPAATTPAKTLATSACSMSGNTLTVKVASGSYFAAGDYVDVAATQTALVGGTAGPAYVGTSVQGSTVQVGCGYLTSAKATAANTIVVALPVTASINDGTTDFIMAVSPAYVTSVAAIATNKLMVALPVDSNLNSSAQATSCANSVSIGSAGAKSTGCTLTVLEGSRYLTITLAAGTTLAAGDTFDFKASQTAITVGTTANGAPYAAKSISLPTIAFGAYDGTVFTATVINSTGIDIALPMASSLSGSACSSYLSFTNSLAPTACTVYQPAGQSNYYLSVNLSSVYIAGSTVTLNLASSTTLTAGAGTTQKYASVSGAINIQASIASAVLVSSTSVLTTSPGAFGTMFLKQGASATAAATTNYVPRLSALVIAPSIQAAYITGATTIKVVLPVAAAVPRANFISSCNSVFALYSAATGNAKSTSSFTSCWLDATDLKTVYLTLTSASSYTAKDYINIVAGQTILTSYGAGTNGRVAFAPRPLSVQIVPQIVSAIATSATNILVQLPIPSYKASGGATGTTINVAGSQSALTYQTASGTGNFGSAATAITIAGSIVSAQATATNVITVTFPASACFYTSSLQAGLVAGSSANQCGTVLAVSDASGAAKALLGSGNACVLSNTGSTTMTVTLVSGTTFAAVISPTILSAVATSSVTIRVTLPVSSSFFDASTPPLSLNSRSLTDAECGTIIEVKSSTTTKTLNGTACSINGVVLTVTLSSATPYAPGDTINIKSGNVMLRGGSTSDGPLYTPATAVPITIGYFVSAVATEPRTVYLTLPFPSAIFPSGGGSAIDPPTLNDCTSVLSIGNPAYNIDSTSKCVFVTSTLIKVTLASGAGNLVAAGNKADMGTGGGSGAIMRAVATGTPTASSTAYAFGTLPTAGAITVGPTITSAAATSATTVSLTLALAGFIPGAAGGVIFNDTQCSGVVAFTPAKTLAATDACRFRSGSNLILDVTLSGSGATGVFAGGDTVNISSSNLGTSTYALYAGGSASGPVFVPYSAGVTIDPNLVSAIAVDVNKVEVTLPGPSYYGTTAPSCDTIIAFTGVTKAYPSSGSCVLDSAKTTLTVTFDGTTTTTGFYAANDQVNVKSDNSVFKAGTTTAGPLYKTSTSDIVVNPSIISAKATGPQTVVVALPTDSAFFAGGTADATAGGISGAHCSEALVVASSALVTKSLKSCLIDAASPRILTVTLADNETFAAGDTINVLAKNSAASSAATKPLQSGTGSSPVRAYKPRASPVKIAAGYILGSYAVSTSDIAIQLPVPAFVSGTDCSSAVLVQSGDATPVTKALASCYVDSGTYLVVTLVSTASFASGDVVTIKSTNAVLFTGSDNTGALYAAVSGTTPNNVLATIDSAYMVSPTTILVTMPAAVTFIGGVSKATCDAVFNFTAAVGGANVTSPIMDCTAFDSSTISVTLNSSALYTPGMGINILKDQAVAKVGGSTGTNLVVFPLDTPISPTLFGSNATLVAPTTVAVPLPGASSLSSTTAASCAASLRITSVLGEDAASPFSGCSVGADGKVLSLALSAPSYAPGQSFNVKSTNSILRLGAAATGALYQPFTSQVPDLPILTSIFTAVLVDPSTVIVNLPAPAAVPANFTLDECLKSLAFLTSAGVAKNGSVVTSCTLRTDRLALTLSLAAPLSLAGGDRVNVKPGQAALRVAALDAGPSYVPKALAQIVTPAFFGSANLTAATSVVVKMPFASALASGADCKTVVALLSTAGAVKNVSSCSLGADGVSLTVTLAAASYTAGDVVNAVPGQTALTLADGVTPYVPSEKGILISPNLVSAALTNATVISVALPTASVLTSTAAADCSAAVVIVSNGSAVASPLSACAVSADGLTLTLTAAATYKPIAGNTVDVAVNQTVLRAGSATGPAYVPRSAAVLITVPSPPPSPPPSPAPSPPPSPPLSTANYSARGLATGPLSCNVLIGANTITTTSGNFTGLPSYAGKDASFSGSCKDAVTGAVYTDDTVASTLPAGLTGLVLAPVTALASVWDISSVADLADTNKDYLRLLGVPVNASAYGSATTLLAYDYYVKGFVALETPAVAVMNVEGMVAANLLMYTKFFDGLNSSVAGRDISAAEALAAGQYALAVGLEMATTPVNTSDPAAILQLINSTYSILTAKNATAAAGRRLLQTAASFTQLQAQATALAAATADSNALVAVQQAKLIAAINAGTSISAADLTNIINEASKVIVTQSTVIANAATGLASGAISPASFTSSYTGSALTTLVAQQQLAATPGSDVTASPPPAPPSEDSKSNTGLIIGLVVGLVGGAIVITLIVVFIVMRRRKQNVAAAGQATA